MKDLRNFGARIIFLVLLTVHCSLLIALDFSFRPKAFVFIPAGAGNEAADGNKRYDVGGGGEVGFEIDLSSVWSNPLGLGYNAGLEGALLLNATKGENPMNMQFYSLSGVLGLYYFPLSRLFTRIDGAVGIYRPVIDKQSGDAAIFWRGSGELGFRFTPGFTLAANAGWRQFAAKGGGTFNSGLYVGLTSQLTFEAGTGSRREGIGVNIDQYAAVYPAFMQLYQNNAIGSVVISNNENAEIRDVRVYFRASNYTASEFPCGSVSIIQRGRSAELPLLADFSPDILRFTDTGRILGELVIRYQFLGQEREAVRAISVATNNRNTVTEGDAAALAAFISPTSPEVLDFSKYIAGLSRANRRPGQNANMQYAIWLFEGLRAGEVKLGRTYSPADEVQFPAETLSYGTGGSRDLALLFAAGLESVGIASAFIQAGDDFLVGVSLDAGQSAAETLFNGSERILVINDNVWLPLSMAAFNEGFSAAWTQGAAVLRQSFAQEKAADFVMVEGAWASYPPAPLPALGGRIVHADAEATTREVNRALQAYIEQEINPIINRQTAAGNTAATQNRLGILYARAGRIADAKAAYERAAGMGSVPAMTNRGNLALIERDYTAAEYWFRQALERESQNSTALRGLEQVEEKR